MGNVRGDSGGRTVWGVAENKHPEMWKNGPPTEEAAKRFYEADYWRMLRLNELEDQGIAEEIFEMAVNTSTPARGAYNPAVEAAQRATNRVRHEFEGEYEPLLLDGRIGRKTIGALNHIASVGRLALLAWDGSFNIEQLRYYTSLEKSKVDRFLRSWSRRVIT